ncbi:MAG TPA: hypothetical protein VHT53_05705 [Candidatus Elarobacter sp.]|jgi:hypothetical protein|nr:hypothetical protein [Candidatus Elarobacter sp.]
MLFDVSGAGLPGGLTYGPEIEAAAVAANFPPCWLYAHGWQETIKVAGWIGTMGKTPATFISDDGGHGIFQLTASYPNDWQDPKSNAAYAIQHFLVPAAQYWNSTYGATGDTLIRCVAAEFNGGRGGAEAGHAEGDVGKFTTHTDGVSYSDLVLKYFHQLAAGQAPSG